MQDRRIARHTLGRSFRVPQPPTASTRIAICSRNREELRRAAHDISAKANAHRQLARGRAGIAPLKHEPQSEIENRDGTAYLQGPATRTRLCSQQYRVLLLHCERITCKTAIFARENDLPGHCRARVEGGERTAGVPRPDRTEAETTLGRLWCNNTLRAQRYRPGAARLNDHARVQRGRTRGVVLNSDSRSREMR